MEEILCLLEQRSLLLPRNNYSPSSWYILLLLLLMCHHYRADAVMLSDAKVSESCENGLGLVL